MSDKTASTLKATQSLYWPVSGLTELLSIAFPSIPFVRQAQWLMMKAKYTY
jgi:hypothetical protein